MCFCKRVHGNSKHFTFVIHLARIKCLDSLNKAMNTLCHSGPLYPDIRVFFCLFVLRASRLAKFKLPFVSVCAFMDVLIFLPCFFSVALGGFRIFMILKNSWGSPSLSFCCLCAYEYPNCRVCPTCFAVWGANPFWEDDVLATFLSITQRETEGSKPPTPQKSQLINQEGMEQTRCCEREELWEFPQTNELRCEETLNEWVVIHLQTP